MSGEEFTYSNAAVVRWIMKHLAVVSVGVVRMLGVVSFQPETPVRNFVSEPLQTHRELKRAHTHALLNAHIYKNTHAHYYPFCERVRHSGRRRSNYYPHTKCLSASWMSHQKCTRQMSWELDDCVRPKFQAAGNLVIYVGVDVF
jgi:hypothetical protein